MGLAASREAKPEVLDCPCCGNQPRHIGPMSMGSCGVECTCGLRMIVQVPCEWPNDTPVTLAGIAALEWLESRILAEAIKRWNTRAV